MDRTIGRLGWKTKEWGDQNHSCSSFPFMIIKAFEWRRNLKMEKENLDLQYSRYEKDRRSRFVGLNFFSV